MGLGKNTSLGKKKKRGITTKAMELLSNTVKLLQ